MLGLATAPSYVCVNRGSQASTSRPVARTARHALGVRASAAASPPKIEINKAPPQPITLSEMALKHLDKMYQEKGEQLVLRIGVKSGGCSGMSYYMNFLADEADKKGDDVVVALEGGKVEMRVDPKSLLYLFGLTLDYSDELIGGGYKFINPNASSSCGCGSSFNV